VGIVGAGPAGLFLSHLLHLHGVDSVVLERRSREYVEQRVRAGVLEQGTVDLMHETGVGERVEREGLVHHGIELRFNRAGHRIPMSDLTGGRTITIYGQQKVVEDLADARLTAGGQLYYEVEDATVHDVRADAPRIRYRREGREYDLHCQFIAGCDGFHGVCRPTIPASALTVYERTYPFAWLGILADVPPSTDELIYASHERGFALHSLRSPHISRLYIQVDPEEDLAAWPDDRIWYELHARFVTDDDWKLREGEVLEKGIAAIRSFVVTPMQYGRLFLAGDAAHIVPATGAKGLNLAVADVRVLAEGIAEFYRTSSTTLLDRYSELCLRRTWRVQRFSWWMTQMLHRFADDETGFQRCIQLAELEYVCSSPAAATSLAENYVGLPFELP
jgi:p-hydroxybenzoate 3-monooxygenase